MPSNPFPPHYDGRRFFNPDSPPPRGFLDVVRWQFTNHRESSPKYVDDVQPSVPPAAVAPNELRVTLINHSTVLLQHHGVHILTDPIWSERASPLASIGPRRRRAPGVRLEDLPRIDIVLLSHNHYDHLDLPTLKRLAAVNKPSQYIVPLGVARFLESQNLGPARELDWGSSLATPFGVNVHAVPAIHFSSRTPFDRNRTLWCGFILEIGGEIIYFAADTAFGNHFSQIREHFGSPRLAFLPIGAYEPRWFMSPVHMGPDEALRAHQILAAQTSVAIHHGTFQLADEGLDTPQRVLREFGADDSFLTLANGLSVTLAL